MEMLDKFLYTFFGKLDDAISFVETYIIKMTEWCWHTRVKLLKKRRRRKSYCARSAGQMKQFPKAAANPNSRLRQARRRWKC